jgi:hypothetical protein
MYSHFVRLRCCSLCVPSTDNIAIRRSSGAALVPVKGYPEDCSDIRRVTERHLSEESASRMSLQYTSSKCLSDL